MIQSYALCSTKILNKPQHSPLGAFCSGWQWQPAGGNLIYQLKSFDWWWETSSNATAGLTKKGFNSLVILGPWTIWNHRNSCVFDGAAPSLAGALGFDVLSWRSVGCGLSFLAPPPLH
jgi:hypothetical protein